MVGMALTTIVAGYMSATKGHWVGGELSDAHGLGFFSWSTTGGDLRIPHFVSMHLAQAIPISALSGSKLVVIAITVAGVLLTLALFVLALNAVPLFRV